MRLYPYTIYKVYRGAGVLLLIVATTIVAAVGKKLGGKNEGQKIIIYIVSYSFI